MTQFSRKKIISQRGVDLTPIDTRITNLENAEYKVTYYEIISGASGSLTLPTGATINAGEFGLSGNAILSKIDGSNKPTFESPKTAGGVVVTSSLNVSTGAWVASGVYTDANVALIYSIKIKAINYGNLTYANIIETVELTDFPITQTITNGVTNKAPSEDAVYDALLTKHTTISKTTTDGTTVTGTTANTLSSSVLIDADSILVGDIIEFSLRSVFVGVNSTKTTRLYFNTSNSLSGATLAATYAGGSAVLSYDMSRDLIIKSASNTETIAATASLLAKNSQSTVAISSLNIDWTVDQYAIVAIQLVNSADLGVVSYIKISN